MSKGKKKEEERVLDPISSLYQYIDKTYGQGLISSMEEIELEEYDVISTGSLRLDIALKEPLTPGVHELAGQEGAGKTTISLEAGASAQKNDMIFFYINMERGLHRSLPPGIKGLDRKKMQVINPADGEQCLDIVDDIVKTVPKCFIVLDSVAALVSEEELAKSMTEETMCKLARMLSKFLKKVNPLLHKQKTVLLLLNQLRTNPGYGAKELPPGGRAIGFYAISRMQLKTNKADQRQNKAGRVIGQKVRVYIKKNRATAPYIEVEIELLFGHGIDKELEILNLAVELGVVEKGGAWFTYKNQRLGQGQENAVGFLKEHKDVFEEIKDKVLGLYDE